MSLDGFAHRHCLLKPQTVQFVSVCDLIWQPTYTLYPGCFNYCICNWYGVRVALGLFSGDRDVSRYSVFFEIVVS